MFKINLKDEIYFKNMYFCKNKLIFIQTTNIITIVLILLLYLCYKWNKLHKVITFKIYNNESEMLLYVNHVGIVV